MFLLNPNQPGGGSEWGQITGTLSDQTDLQTALNAKAGLAGATFTGDVLVPDEIYGPGWNGSLEVPTKNALYDKIETITSTPGGTDGQMQYNNGGVFGGMVGKYNDTNSRTGLVETTPIGSLHVGETAETVDAPSGSSGVLTLETSINSPASAGATQVDAPTDPAGLSFGFTYIDQPVDNMWYANQTTGSGGFICSGQTIYYSIYAFRTVGGIRVVNPTAFTLINFTDTINDNSTQFYLDIGNWTTPNSYQDGFIIYRSDNLGTATKAIGNTTTYQDTYFTDQDSFTASSYVSSGATWNSYIAQYKTINGTKYRTSYLNYNAADSNISSAYLILNNSWSAAVNDGFIYQGNASNFSDVGTAVVFDDYGQSNVSDFSTFSASAFPYLNTSLTGTSGTTASFVSSGSITADNSYYDIEVWEYRTFTLNSIKYYVGTPESVATPGTDPNDSNGYNIDGSLTPGDGDGRVVKLFQTPSGGSRALYAAVNIGGGTSFSFSTTSADIDTSNSIASYSGITRDFSAYGYITSPSTKYSSSANSYSFTDNNPVGGYMIAHSWATPGNATGYKVLESSYRSGSLYWNNTVSSFTQDNAGLGDSTVTPATIGYLAAGQTLTYRLYAVKTINGQVTYSSTYDTVSKTFNNSGNYYTVDLTIGTVSGATYKVNKVGIGYETSATTSFTDSTLKAWNGSSTLTPTSAPGSTGIFDKSGSSNSIPSAVLIRNTTSNGLASFLEFQANQSGSYSSLIKIGVKIDGNIAFAPTGSVGTGGIDFGPLSTPYNRFAIGSGSSGNIFNVQGTSSRDTTFKGNSVDLGKFDTILNTVYFGTNNLNYDPTSAVAIQANSTSDTALLIYPRDGATGSDTLLRIKNSSASTLGGFTNNGQGFFAASSINNGHVYIGAGNTTYSQLQFANTSSLATTNAGGMSYSSNILYFNNGTHRSVELSFDSSTAYQYRFSDVNGKMTSNNNLTTNVSNNILIANILIQGKQGLSLDSGKDLTMNGTGSILGPIRTVYLGSTANVTIGTNAHIFNATANSFNYTLPTAVGISGREYYVINSGTGTSTILTTSSQTINGLASGAITLTQRKGLMLIADGANYISPGVLASAIVGTVAPTDGGTGVSTVAQGDLLYGSASNVWSKLTKDTNATRYLSNTGTSNNPAWAQINVSNGVTGVLSEANGGSGVAKSNLFDYFADAIVGGAEADIYTSTTAAGQLATNGQKIIAEYGGNFVTGGTELTQLKAYFAGNVLWDSTGVAPTTGTTSWRVYVEIIRKTSTSIVYTVSLQTTGASGFVYCKVDELAGLTLSGTNILKITGTSTGVGSGSGDIVGKMGYVRYVPAA